MSVHEVIVYPRDQDPQAQAVERQADLMFGEPVEVRRTAAVYLLETDEGVGAEGVHRLAGELLRDPVTEICEVREDPVFDDSNCVRVGLKPGVQDPGAAALLRGAKSLGVPLAAAATATEYYFSEVTAAAARERVVGGLLVNPTVQEVQKKPKDTLRIQADAAPVEDMPTRYSTLTELRKLSNERSLHLGDSDLQTIQVESRRLGRDLTDVELEFIAARRSDHCAHTTFGAEVFDKRTGEPKAPLFTRIKDTAREVIAKTGAKNNILSAFDDNAGVISFYEGQAIALKKESHNSPSALEPYGGAGTGTGGVIRDILGCGKGFKPILLDCMFGLASPGLNQSRLPAGCLPPAYLRRRVVDGTRDYGNRMGIPTGEVRLLTDDDWRARCTVLAGAYGIAPAEHAQKGTPQTGDLLITFGGRTGADGLHGATFSSANMTGETATVNANAVQIGDPITQQKLAEALLEVRDNGLIRAITDCGAAGFGSAVGEIGETTGVTIDLDAIPVKYAGLSPWQLLLSESQERMVMAMDPEHAEQFDRIMRKHDVEWAQIGRFDGSGSFTARYEGEVVAELGYDFLLNGFKRGVKTADYTPGRSIEFEPSPSSWPQTFAAVLAHPNVCSTETVIRQYDHGVQGTAVLPPYGGKHLDMPNDATVIAPLRDLYPDKPYGLIRANASNPMATRADAYHGAVASAAEALARFVAVGGCPANTSEQSVALMNNYVWPTPEDPATFGALDRAVDGVNDVQRTVGIPVISGKDSVSSRYKGKTRAGNEIVVDIPPVVDMTVVGGTPDIRKTISADIKQAGSTLVLVGAPDYEGMAATAFQDVTGGIGGRVPTVDLERLPRTLTGMHQAIQTGSVLSASAVSRGGVGASVAKMSFGGDTGAELVFDEKVRLTRQLFNETAGCIVAEVEAGADVAELFGDVPHTVIGRTTAEGTITVRQGSHTIHMGNTGDLRAAWKQTMEDF